VRWVTWGRFENGRDEFAKKELGKKLSTRTFNKDFATRTPQQELRKKNFATRTSQEELRQKNSARRTSHENSSNRQKEFCKTTLYNHSVEQFRRTIP
jgi:hypothetical protein